MSSALDLAFSALASNPRREILTQLDRGPATLADLRDAFDFTKQAMTRHVAVLEEAGLVRREVRGRIHELRLVPETLQSTQDWLNQRAQAWTANFQRLHHLLEEGS